MAIMTNRSINKMKTRSSPRVQRLNGVAAVSVSLLLPEQIYTALEWLLLLCPFLFGCFFPWGSALVSLVLIALLLFLIRRRLLCRTHSAPFLAAVSID